MNKVFNEKTLRDNNYGLNILMKHLWSPYKTYKIFARIYDCRNSYKKFYNIVHWSHLDGDRQGAMVKIACKGRAVGGKVNLIPVSALLFILYFNLLKLIMLWGKWVSKICQCQDTETELKNNSRLHKHSWALLSRNICLNYLVDKIISSVSR